MYFLISKDTAFDIHLWIRKDRVMIKDALQCGASRYNRPIKQKRSVGSCFILKAATEISHFTADLSLVLV